MEHLTDISVTDLQSALAEVEGKKPTQRLIAAIAYKNGITQTELADWYGVERRTIYSWLKRLEQEPLVEAVHDNHRSGRPRKLTDEQRMTLNETLHQPPHKSGYAEQEWTPLLVRAYILDAFDVTYSIPSCRRLMKEAGL